MRRLLTRLVVTTGVFGAITQPLSAQQKAATTEAAPQVVKVCPLVSKEEVKKHIPWQDFLDGLPIDEEAIGTTGSSCNFPTVHVQVMRYHPSTIESARKMGNLETIAGIGDEAYFRNNRDRYAELLVKVGSRMLTLQGSVPQDGSIASVKPGVLSLAKVYVAKLR